MRFSIKGPRSFPKFVKFIIPGVIASVLISVAGVRYWYTSNLRPLDENNSELFSFNIELGDSIVEIAQALEDSDLIKDATVFTWFVKGDKAGVSLQAGNYSVSPSMSVPIIVELFAEGRIDSELITILPAKRLDETRQELIAAGWSVKEVDKALASNYRSHPLLKNLPKGATLEGYLYPDSYRVNDNSSLNDLITRTFDNFYQKITERNLEPALVKQGFNLHEAITLASIIEEESGSIKDKAQIAQVLIKRLNNKVPLGADATFRYAAAVLGQAVSVNIESPYNTRLYGGLTPGPIANFPISALDAVANPASGDYLYFVAGDDGVTRFSNTVEEHNTLKQKYCIELCKL